VFAHLINLMLGVFIFGHVCTMLKCCLMR